MSMIDDKKIPDISNYYIGQLAEAEEAEWLRNRLYRRNDGVENGGVARTGAKSVIELGCGSGNVAACVTDGIDYAGVDANDTFLGYARAKSPGRKFIKEDLRNVTPTWLDGRAIRRPDVSCAFSVLPHFGLHEWDDRLHGLLKLAQQCVFDCQTAISDFDNGTDYHHSFVTEERLMRVLAKERHIVMERWVTREVFLDDGTPTRGILFVTADLLR